MTLLNIAGGVALILFGIRFLRKGLERIFGRRLYAWIERAARRPWQAAGAGLAFGTVAPSSTAQTLVALQLLRAGRLSPESVLGFLLGANLGITFTVQLIALRIFDYHAVLIIGGLICYQGCKRDSFRGAGQACLGLGFVFLAMTLISAAAAELTARPEFATLLGLITPHPWFVVVFAALLTLLMQSSTATLGLALAIGGTGAAQLDLVLPAVLGANLGIGLTSLLAGFASWEGRRLAVANLLFKGAGVAAGLALLPALAARLGGDPAGIARDAADFHTGFNLVVTVAGVMLAAPLGWLLRRTLQAAPAAPGATPPATHLDPAALQTPVFALANATRETLREADAVKGMFEGAWQAFLARDAALAATIQGQDDRVDELNAGIKAYLSQIQAESLSPQDQQLQFGLLNFASQLESIADVIDKSLCGSVRSHASDGVEQSPEQLAELQELYRRVLRRFDTAISVLATRDRELARRFLQESDELKEWCIAVQKRHYAALAADPAAITASTRFLDTFNLLRRISGQLNTIGHTFTLE
ncbi:MAG TPA: Na/Pi cotransporter family protein [Lacunisphaera sp.]|nr:Na/Pi cotransporter family protein [Lacunisphaera sp.]